MRWQALLVGLLHWLGLLAFLAVAAVVAYAQVAPAQGLEDLARVVVALLGIGIGGALLGASLLLAWALGVRPSGWRTVLGIFGCILGAIVGFGLLGTAVPANWGLVAFALVVLLLSAGGIVASARLWRGGAAVA